MSEHPGPGSDGPQITVLTKGRRKAAFGFIFFTAVMDITSLGIMIPVLPNLIKEMVAGATRRPPTIAWLFVGRVLNGITAASFSTAGAYIADVSAPEERAKNFGLIGAAFGFGFLVGPAIGGWLTGDFVSNLIGGQNLRLPFYFAAGLGLINWLYGFFVLPESLPPERREPRFNWAKANPVGSLRLLSRHKDLLGLAGVSFLFNIAHSVFPSIFVLYSGHRFGWSPEDTGYVMMIVGLSNILVQATIIGRAVKALGERGVLLVGLFSFMVALAIYGFATEGWHFILGIPIAALSGLIAPGLQGLMTRRVEPWEQGQLQGANSAIVGIVASFIPLVYTGILAWSVPYKGQPLLAGSPLFFAALVVLLAFALAVKVAKPQPAPVVVKAAG